MPILRLAGKAPHRRRPVNSALGGKASMVGLSSSPVQAAVLLPGEPRALAQSLASRLTKSLSAPTLASWRPPSSSLPFASLPVGFSIGALRHQNEAHAALTSFGVRGWPSRSVRRQFVACVAQVRLPSQAVRRRQRTRRATGTNSLLARFRRGGHTLRAGVHQPCIQQPWHGSTPSCRLTRR